MSPTPLRQPKSRVEAWFYNQGVLDVLTLAKQSAAAISATSKRSVHEAFATAALSELADAGMALLIDESEAAPVGPVDGPRMAPKPVEANVP